MERKKHQDVMISDRDYKKAGTEVTKLTIDQALQQGIEAHKSGQLQEADRLYTAILKAHPKHPDANHNMGVLAVSVGKVKQALSFFKTALEANPNTAQFWRSYIDALIKLENLADAKVVFDQAKSKGAKGDGFDKLERRLNDLNKDTLSETLEINQIDTLDIAMQLREIGDFNQAIEVLEGKINQFPENANMLTLLSHCYLLADQVGAAKIYLDKAKKILPENASVGWNTVRLTLKEQKPLEALNIARDFSQRFPDDVEGMGVLGACLRVNSEVSESLKVLNLAIELNPNYAEALVNRGLIRLSQKDKLEALADLEKAHKIKPYIKEIWHLVIGLKAEAKQYLDAILLLINMIEIDPNWEEGLSLLGVCNQKADDSALAVKAFEKVLEVKPGSASIHVNLGIALTKKGETKTAIDNFKKALSIKPDYAEAYINMGNALTDQGKPEEALASYNKALAIKPDYSEAYYNLGIALKGLEFNQSMPSLQKTIRSLLSGKSFVRPKDIAPAVISLLKFDQKLKRHLQLSSVNEVEANLSAVIKDLSGLPLLLEIMSICPLPDLSLENLLSALRASLLLSISNLTGSPEELKFQTALALQCFTNEYIYNQSEHEDECLEVLEVAVKQTLSNGDQPSPQSILCLASYRPLNQYEWSSWLRITNELEDVFTRLVVEPNQEANLKSVLPVLEEITDEVSSKVRDQYEVSPYPRWVNLGLRLQPAPISKLVEEIKLKLFDDAIKEVEAPNILIAGCGTGQHSIGTATRFEGSKVLAIDLSLSSLSYAKRKTEELGIKNIDYMQADILDLAKLGRKFDIVESSGVLHHMEDPLEGWRVLTDCLKPGGLMRIGLYSELARQHIVEMRQEISKAGIGTSDAAMKSFRKTVITSDKNHHKEILNSTDFYSLSTLKDLLFHVQEHRFTIPQIQNCLTELGLKFCGFEGAKIVSSFKLTNTDTDDAYNLEKWEEFEEANPRAFAGMYQFWCQKVA
jgi:tetratricopeptide (TPR) repeat protein/2-polyprenyl-3-methyl-5-hydroxy-6-metoxy-1,4-benzoquinol methylase